jgi:hypothetical protein
MAWSWDLRRVDRASVRKVMAALLLVLVSVNLQAATPTLTASLDRNTVPVGESLQLTLTFRHVTPTQPPTLPPMPNIQVAGVSQSSFVNIEGGQMTRQFKYIYTLVPRKVGRITLPKFTAQVGGRALQSQVLTLNVIEANTSNQPKPALVRLRVPKKIFYVGEVFAAEIMLYWQNGRDIRTPQLQAEGFSVSENFTHTQTRTRIGNTAYNLLLFKVAVTAARSGDLVLGPAVCNLNLLIPQTNQRRDPFDLFGTRMRSQPAELKSDPLTVKVLPLPSNNVPESFNGAVGQFTMTVKAGPNVLAVGDPITVQATITGNGLLSSLRLPEQTQWRDFKSYPPTSNMRPNDELGLSGSVDFEQVVIPENHEITMLPPLQFSYFNPATKSYQTLSNQPIPITVSHASVTASPPPALTNGTTQVTQPIDDIIHINAQLGGVLAQSSPLIYSPWFIILQAIPLGAWLTMLTLRKRQESLARNPRLQRQRKASLRIRQGLQELEQLASNEDQEAFHAEMFRVLQEMLGERLDLPASAITEAVIDDKLSPLGLAPETLQSLHSLFQACNQARYAPNQSAQLLSNLLTQLKNAQQELQQMKS